jgi:type IV pilus assembly protein PilC
MFPTMCIQMLKIGEETGAVETMLEKVAQYYEEQVEITTANLTTLMEPMIIVVLGGIVGVLVMAMYMPMINMMGGLENL